MTAEMDDGDVLFDPVVEFVDGCSFSYIVDVAGFECFLDDGFFLKIVDLVVDLSVFLVDHRLTIEI